MVFSLSLYQLIIVCVAGISISRQVYKFVKKEKFQSLFKLLVIVSVWCGVLMLILFPQLAHVISSTLGMGSNLNTLIFTGFIIVFILIFKLLAFIEKIERNITEIVRKEALKDLYIRK